jgi:hypothetical protein
MTKRQFFILLGTSMVLVILIAVNGYLQFQDQKYTNIAQGMQNYILKASQVDTPLQNLITRVAADSDKEPRLKEILTKRGVKATLNIDGQERQYP